MKDKDTPEFDFDSPASSGMPGADERKPTGGGSSPRAGESIAAGGDTCRQAGERPATYWQEVPQARFLSWSPQMQAAYCASRDLDSAESAANRGEDPEFYLERAEGYAVEALR